MAKTPLKLCSPSQGQMHFMLNMDGRDWHQSIKLYQHLSNFSDQTPDRSTLREKLFIMSEGTVHGCQGCYEAGHQG